MPTKTTQTSPLAQLLKQMAERRADPMHERRRFLNSFRRSKAGNLWAKRGETLMTIFFRDDGRRMAGWRWVIDGRFSQGLPFHDPDDAINDLFDNLPDLEAAA